MSSGIYIKAEFLKVFHIVDKEIKTRSEVNKAIGEELDQSDGATMKFGNHGKDFFLRSFPKLTKAFWDELDERDYIVLTQNFFKDNACSFMGNFPDAFMTVVTNDEIKYSEITQES